MAFFTGPLSNPDASFTPLWRLLDDFDNYNRQGQGGSRSGLLHWQPKFDMCETNDTYELQGELPGMKKEEVYIEFTEPHTMVIRGKTERAYTSGTPPAGFIEGSMMHGAITGGSEEQKTSRQATNENEGVFKTVKHGKDSETKPGETAKYWLSERSIGEFSRTFSFPSRVDQDAVSANFKDGILHIVVPKAPKHEPRRRIHVN